MPGNLAGRASALTAIGPLRDRHWRFYVLRLGFFARRHCAWFRHRKAKTLRDLGFIHYARWVLIDELPLGDGGRMPLEPTYMYFESNFNGGFDEYIDAFSYVIGNQINEIFGSAYSFPRAVPATQFKAFIRRHGYEAEHFYSAYPEREAAEIAAGLEAARLLDPLLDRPACDDHDAFAVAWRRLVSKARL